MGRTALACAAALLLSVAAAQWLTRDFQVWTAEGARRLDVALHPLPAPRVVVDGPGFAPQTLQQLLSQERAVTVVDFMYTRCVTVCTALGGVFQQLQASILGTGLRPGAPALRLLSISFDPGHDDPAVLARYAATLRADPDVWRFARASDATQAQRLLNHYQVTVVANGPGDYEHNAALLVVDPAARLVRVFDYAEQDLALAYARSLVARTPLP